MDQKIVSSFDKRDKNEKKKRKGFVQNIGGKCTCEATCY